MKLNQDCVRDLLLYFEENLSYNHEIRTSALTLKDYSSEDLTYTTDKLLEAGYINARSINADLLEPIFFVYSITYSGHQFLDNIRDENVYEKTKALLSTFKSVSIEIFSETASKVITNIISKQLGLPN